MPGHFSVLRIRFFLPQGRLWTPSVMARLLLLTERDLVRLLFPDAPVVIDHGFRPSSGKPVQFFRSFLFKAAFL